MMITINGHLDMKQKSEISIMYLLSLRMVHIHSMISQHMKVKQQTVSFITIQEI